MFVIIIVHMIVINYLFISHILPTSSPRVPPPSVQQKLINTSNPTVFQQKSSRVLPENPIQSTKPSQTQLQNNTPPRVPLFYSS